MNTRFAVIGALIEKRVRGWQEDGANPEEIQGMVIHEVEAAELAYPGFIAWAESESADLLTWYDILF